MIHYHGGPIWPATAALKAWSGGHAFISYACVDQIQLASSVCQSFALDNGAFSLWKSGTPTDWNAFYDWVGTWRTHPGFDFAVVPDVIMGSEDENDALAETWPFPRHEAAVVWHLNESIERLEKLAENWPRVAIGSCAEFDVHRLDRFLPRAFEAISAICDENGRPKCKLHGLRMLNPEIFTKLPLSSADSTHLARVIKMGKLWVGTYQPRSTEVRAAVLRERIESENGVGALVSVAETPATSPFGA